MTALDEQTVTVPGMRAAELVLPKLADQLAGLLAQRTNGATQMEEMLDSHSLAQARAHLSPAKREGGTSMPGVASGPAHTSCSKSAAPPPSPPLATWRPTPGSYPSPAAPAPPSAGNTPAAQGTRTSDKRSSSPRSPPSKTPPHTPTTTANEPKVNATTLPSSASRGAAATSCTPCCVTARRTNQPAPSHRSPLG